MAVLKIEIPIVDIELYQGNHRAFEIAVTTDGEPLDLSDAEFKMTIKPQHGSEFDMPSESLTVAENVITLTFPADLTLSAMWRQAQYDILNVAKRQTLLRGKIKLLGAVTK